MLNIINLNKIKIIATEIPSGIHLNVTTTLYHWIEEIGDDDSEKEN